MASTPQSSRPLSPHLSIYRFHFSMALSILHRAAGVAVAGMLVILIAWIWAAAYSDACFNAIQSALVSLPGQVVLVAASFVFYFKLATGLRHLLWDTGRAFEKRDIDRTGVAAILFSIAATALTWAIVWEVL
jgi:succinate dehydrogenase / fumarate reductase cytochrome b subunit